MTYGLTNEKGFIRNHQLKREHYYWNTHRSASRLDTNKAFRFPKAHKRCGASKGLNAKQFDTSRRNYCKHFLTKKSIADIVYLPHIVWGFGHHLTLGGNQKFAFSP